MKKIALIYWPKKGSTEAAAHMIHAKFEKEAIDIFTITEINTAEFSLYDAFIIGGSTTGADNWESAHKTRWTDFFDKLDKAELKGKPFALYGLGNQVLYPNHFVDGMAFLKEIFEKHGAVLKGLWPVEGYDFEDSESVENGMFFGLALDFDTQDELTDDRITKWVAQLRKEFGN
ncbi:MAG: flavodoxin [Bacteroidales bacterium]|nr:flavodoxin [Bacteroidales bacterium]